MSALWQQLLAGIMDVLVYLYGIVGDFGLSIIVLTIAMRVVMIPLTAKQTKSTHEMQRVQPKIKEIQKKYKEDKQKQQEELMKFYQENKVNPFGGCLPLVIQMPVFIALFQVLRSNLAEYIGDLPAAQQEAARSFWIILPDLTMSPQEVLGGSGVVAAIPYLVFVVLFGLSAWLPQKMLTKDPQQSKMGGMMALMMLWFGWISPGGVLVYWVTSSLWQIGQQALILRLMPQEEGAKG